MATKEFLQESYTCLLNGTKDLKWLGVPFVWPWQCAQVACLMQQQIKQQGHKYDNYYLIAAI